MAEIVRADDPLDLRFSESELERHREHITSFIADQRAAAGAEAAVIGLSGGIDSTLTAHLAVEALGSEAVYGLVMPSTVSSEESTSDAERVAAELLDIEYDVVEIDPLVEAMLDAHPNVDAADADAEDLQVTVGNLRARLRAVLSYMAANRRGGFVVGTGNRSEAAVGYFTKYGDGAVDCHPIANLYKQQVRQLARHVGVPEDLAMKTPTAELWHDQTDEAELGVGYDTLDAILALHVDGPLSVSATARHLDIDEDVVADVRAMYETSAHKRHAPPGPERLY
jgi:NAD+ synthase